MSNGCAEIEEKRDKQFNMCIACQTFKRIEGDVWGCPVHKVVKAENQPCKDFIQRNDGQTAWDDMEEVMR